MHESINVFKNHFKPLVCRSLSFETRVSTVLEWLSLPEGERYDLFFMTLPVLATMNYENRA